MCNRVQNLCACASKCAHVHFFAQDVQIIAKVHIEIFISIIRIQKESAETIQSSKAKQLGIHPQANGILYNSWKAPPRPPSRENNNKTATTKQPTTCKNETGSNANNISLNVSAQAPKGCEEVSSRALSLMQQPCLEHWIIAWGWQKNCHKKDRGCLFYFIHVYVNKLCIRIIWNVW